MKRLKQSFPIWIELLEFAVADFLAFVTRVLLDLLLLALFELFEFFLQAAADFEDLDRFDARGDFACVFAGVAVACMQSATDGEQSMAAVMAVSAEMLVEVGESSFNKAVEQ